MKEASFVAKAFLVRRKGNEVFYCFRNCFSKESNFNASNSFVANRHVEVDLHIREK